MHRVGFCALIAVGSFVLNLATSQSSYAQPKQWVTIKGRIVWQGDVPKQAPVNITADKAVCAMTKAPMEEDFVINPKNKGVLDTFIWIRPTGLAKAAPFPKADINPALMAPGKKPLLIDQPCCKFEPHVLAAREGETLVINGSPKIAHNAKWESESNGNINPLIPAGGKFDLPKPLVAESGVIQLACSIHPWMKCWVRVFDHPYYAVTDEDGKFEIKLAPVGNYSLFVQHPANGWLDGKKGRDGKKITFTIKDGVVDLGDIKMAKNP